MLLLYPNTAYQRIQASSSASKVIGYKSFQLRAVKSVILKTVKKPQDMYLFNPILMINIKSTKFGPRASISIQLTNQITCFLCKPSLLVFCNMFFDFVCKSVHELDSKVILNLPTITNTFNQRKTFF